MGFIDLHVHSTASDGAKTPEELVRYACEKGLYAFALTDHDTVSGIPAALLAARNYPVKVIPGVEISSALGGRIIHILGYNINYEHPGFIGSLRTISHYRDERNLKICAQMRSYGMQIDYESFRASLPCRMVTRMHFADYMTAHHFTTDRKEAFRRYLAKGQPCYIPMQMIPTNVAVRLIRKSGGLAVLAHPVQYHMTEKGYLQLFTLVKGFGVTGVEAIYPDNTPDQEQLFTGMARNLGMFITGGSDYHGGLNPGIDLGTGRGNLMIPQSLLQYINQS